MKALGKATSSIRSAWLSHALLGAILLMMSASVLLRLTTRATIVGAGLAICGGIALAASWALYGRRPFARTLYGASWGVLVVGWVTLGYFSELRPLWFTLGVAAIMSVAAVLSMFDISRRMSGHGGRDSDT
jgi:hypothetical protein